LRDDQIVPGNLPTVSVVIPTYSLVRWDYLREAVASIQAKTVKVLETIVAVDHNPELLAKATREIPEVTVAANTSRRGASGSRNTGVAASHGQVVAFLDDDAVAHPNCLEVLLQPLTDPSVVGVGGRLEPMWQTSWPRWFPLEFDWAVGCSYRKMPESATIVRNVWSNNMAIRRDAFDAIGGFRDGFVKVGTYSHPEDTDLCLRAAVYNGAGIWIYESDAVARHQVPADRATLGYFFKRCYHEGKGKAAPASFNGIAESTSVERRYARRVLQYGFIRGLLEAVRGEASGAARSFAIATGMSWAIAGFLANRSLACTGTRRERPVSSQ
jgi:cellulose synthase/poly-beta-1,6-N-acetylglucosamine synthase-like glycosyltransferase